MSQPPSFSNWHVDAYLEGRIEEIPQEVLSVVKDIAERRNVSLTKVREMPGLQDSSNAELLSVAANIQSQLDGSKEDE